jgi:hypothetical protein
MAMVFNTLVLGLFMLGLWCLLIKLTGNKYYGICAPTQDRQHSQWYYAVRDPWYWSGYVMMILFMGFLWTLARGS